MFITAFFVLFFNQAIKTEVFHKTILKYSYLRPLLEPAPADPRSTQYNILIQGPELLRLNGITENEKE